MATIGRTYPPVKPRSELAHRPASKKAAMFCEMCPGAEFGYWATGYPAWERCYMLGRCGIGTAGGEQPRETKSAPETRCGAGERDMPGERLPTVP